MDCRTKCLRAALVVLTGCGSNGPKLASVRGTVTYKGKKLPYGTVMFQPDEGQAATGEIHAAFLDTFDRQQQIGAAARFVARHLSWVTRPTF